MDKLLLEYLPILIFIGLAGVMGGALIVVPLLIAGYLVLVARKRRAAEKFSAWMPSRADTPRHMRIAAHIPAVLLLLVVQLLVQS